MRLPLRRMLAAMPAFPLVINASTKFHLTCCAINVDGQESVDSSFHAHLWALAGVMCPQEQGEGIRSDPVIGTQASALAQSPHSSWVKKVRDSKSPGKML